MNPGDRGDGPHVTVKLFAWLRDLFGRKEVFVTMEKAPDIARLLDHLRDLSCDGRGLLDDSGRLEEGFIVLLNGRSIDFLGGVEVTLSDGDEIAVFPPIAGG